MLIWNERLVAIGTMKALDIWARRDNFPQYTARKRPLEWKLALIMLTELRYESFTPNRKGYSGFVALFI